MPDRGVHGQTRREYAMRANGANVSDPSRSDREDGWVRIGTRKMFRRGRGRTVELEDRSIAVFDERGTLYALQDACPHMGASLADGRIKNGQVECSWHHWRFALDDGRCTIRDWKGARAYPIEVRGDDVWVHVSDAPETGSEEPAEPDDDMIAWDDSKFFKKD